MKKTLLVIITFFFLTGIANAEYPGFGFSLPSQTTTQNIPGSPFTITKEATFKYVQATGSYSAGYRWVYDCYINLPPDSAHANMQRVEYIGCQVTHTDGSRKFYQLFPSGGLQELTDINQALYSPSRIAMQPSSVGKYFLFTSYQNFDIANPQTFLPLAQRIPMSFFIQQIDFMAGYGFLTPDDIALINQYKEVVNSPELQNQPGITLLDENTMKWSLAQGNMFKYTSYYNVLSITPPQYSFYLP